MGEFVPADKFQPQVATPSKKRTIGRGIWIVYLGCAGLWIGSYLHNLGAIVYSMLVINGAIVLVLVGTLMIVLHQRTQRTEAELQTQAENKRRLDMMNKWSR